VIVRKVAGQGEHQLGTPRVNDSQPVSREPKQRAIFLVTRTVGDSFDDAWFRILWRDGDSRNVVAFPKPLLAKSGLRITCFRDSGVK
jgi:hypothetical protein